MGQLFHYLESPNRFGLPAFYTLHVWAWKDNPNGAFVNWHPNVNRRQLGGQARLVSVTTLLLLDLLADLKKPHSAQHENGTNQV